MSVPCPAMCGRMHGSLWRNQRRSKDCSASGKARELCQGFLKMGGESYQLGGIRDAKESRVELVSVDREKILA